MNTGVTMAKSMTNDICPRSGLRVPFDTISSPGAYVCDWSGHLLRIPHEAVAPTRCPGLNIVGCEPLTVTKLSDDPDLPLGRARGLAKQLGLTVGF